MLQQQSRHAPPYAGQLTYPLRQQIQHLCQHFPVTSATPRGRLMALVLVASLYLAVLHRLKQQTPATVKEGLASVRWFLGLGRRPVKQRSTLGVCWGLHARLRGSGAVRIMRDGVILPTVIQLAGKSSLCHMHALYLNIVTYLHDLVSTSSSMHLLSCTPFDSLAAFAAHLCNTTASRHLASQCRHQHTTNITACVSHNASMFHAPACLLVLCKPFLAALCFL